MLRFTRRLPATVRLGLFAALVTVAPAARADEKDRLFDFTDAYYLQNGVNPANIGGRRQAVLPNATTGTPFYSFQRPVRALLTLPAYGDNGSTHYFTVMGGGSASLFTTNAAGQRAKQVADTSFEYVFPRAGGDPFSLGATRQSVVLDMRNGYFSNNPLGLWLHVWVTFNDKNLDTKDAQRELADMARRNGRDLDGTPIIRTVGDIDRMASKNLIVKRTRAASDGLRYAICPVIKDPTDGGIAVDQFLAITRKPDGSPLEPSFLMDFDSLRLTGQWFD